MRHAYNGKLLAIVTAGSRVTAKLGAAPLPPAVDASYSGGQDTIPAAMTDGNPATAWSNFYSKAASRQLPATSLSHASDWVALNTPTARTVSGLNAAFVTGGAFTLPASVEVDYWNGQGYAPVTGLAWNTDQISFDPVSTTRVRLTMVSPAPGTSGGFLKIAELSAAP